MDGHPRQRECEQRHAGLDFGVLGTHSVCKEAKCWKMQVGERAGAENYRFCELDKGLKPLQGGRAKAMYTQVGHQTELLRANTVRGLLQGPQPC